MRILKNIICTACSILILASCATDSDRREFHSKVSESTPLKSVAVNKKVDMAVIAAVDLIRQGEYKKASTLINTRLQDEPANVAMHILNGITYEKLAEAGDSGRLDLAVVGYESALNVDPNNQLALQRLAHLRFKKREYDKAQELYANALLLKPDDSALLQELAAASYYAYDLKTAQIAIQKAVAHTPDDLLAQRSATMIYAALGEFDGSKKHFDKYKALAGDDPDIQVVSSRINDWKSLYSSGRIQLAQRNEFQAMGDDPSGEPISESLATQVLDLTHHQKVVGGSAAPGSGSLATTQGSIKPEKQQIIIDCYLLRIEEMAGTSKGNNILENLEITLTPGGYLFGRSRFWGSGVLGKGLPAGGSSPPGNTISNVGTLAATSATLGANSPTFSFNNSGDFNFTSFYGGLSWSGLSYNLNIANVRDNRTEVIARPSLLTFLNQESVFFSGTELVVGLIGSDGGNLVKYPVGVTLVVTPTEIDASTDTVTLNISVEGAEFNTPNITQDLTTTVNVGKTRIDTKAKVKLGQTLALGGIYERVEVFQKSGVPGLSDVPIVQYFFSNEQSTTDRRSVVILMTPRSPDKTREDVVRAIAEDRNTPYLDELERRNKDWFTTAPNLAKILTYMSVDPIIYREFRSVDVLPPSWGEPDNFFDDGWAMLFSFMYY